MTIDLLKRVAPLAVILVIAVIGYIVFGDRISFQTLSENRDALLAYRDAHYGLAALVFILAYTAIVGFSLPGATVSTLTGGFLFGLFPGVVFNVLAASMGATIIFSAARLGLGERLAARMDAGAGRIAMLKRGIDRNQWSVLFLMRLAPIVPFFAANVIPAFLNVPTWRFVVTTVIGIIPGALIYTSVGSGLGDVFDQGGTPDLSVIFEPFILGPIIGLCALAVLPMLIRVLRKDPAP